MAHRSKPILSYEGKITSLIVIPALLYALVRLQFITVQLCLSIWLIKFSLCQRISCRVNSVFS
jgi:hypothetical protein